MPEFLDTSVLVRYLTADPPAQAERARRLIESDSELHVTETALVETAHVLRKVYGLTREDTVDLLLRFIQRANITVQGLHLAEVVRAFGMARPSGRVSIPDGMIWAAARTHSPSTVYAFDERFPAADIDLRNPAQ
jgi:predicted nucleic acid-binding protein